MPLLRAELLFATQTLLRSSKPYLYSPTAWHVPPFSGRKPFVDFDQLPPRERKDPILSLG